jgi:hypothetical protein
VGSSRKSSRGRPTSSMPMLTRFFCPPEIRRLSLSLVTHGRWRCPSSPSTSSTHSSRRDRSCRGVEGGSLHWSCASRFSSTVSSLPPDATHARQKLVTWR